MAKQPWGEKMGFTPSRKARKEGQTHNFLLASGQRKSFQFMNFSKSEIETSVFKQFLASLRLRVRQNLLVGSY